MSRDDAIDRVMAALHRHLRGFGSVAVAVSGGVDSLTLATAARRSLADRARMYHAVSAAVPPEATRRVRERAALESWQLELVDARELDDPRYVANPANRCFFCKQSLYRAIAGRTKAQILSGTNADDLGDYRPGLDAARGAGVRHPFVELGIDKRTIRQIGRRLGLGEIADLPAAPCLASRIETGIPVTAGLLARVHAAEMAVRQRVAAGAVRCRVRGAGVVIEIDAQTLGSLSEDQKSEIAAAVAAAASPRDGRVKPSFAPYRTGSAFLVTHD